MPQENQYLQTQLTDLAVDVASQKSLTHQAIDNMGENKAMLKAVHSRMDEFLKEVKIEIQEIRKEVSEVREEASAIREHCIDREELKEELETLVNAKVGSWVINSLWALIASGSALFIAWWNDLLKGMS